MGRNTESELERVRVITGEVILTSKRSIVGYCHFTEHKGCITKSLLKEHECVSKECHYFEKFKDNPYWNAIEQQRAAKQRKRQTAKRIMNEEKALQLQWIETAQNISDSLGYHIKIVSIKKTPRKKHYVLFYISNQAMNDWYKYLDLAKAFGFKINCRAELRHIKAIDGTYATL